MSIKVASAFLLTALCLSSCSNEPTGWTEEKVSAYIACEPAGSEVCQCVVARVMKKYTPEQVKEKSPFVVKEMLEIRNDCDGSASESEVIQPKPPE